MSGNCTAKTSRAERARRQRAVNDAAHSLDMAGLAVANEDMTAAAEYVDGAISLDAFIAQELTRFTKKTNG